MAVFRRALRLTCPKPEVRWYPNCGDRRIVRLRTSREYDAVEVIAMNCPIIVHDWLPEPMLEHEIRLRAYYLFVRRGKREGHALDDWLKAENEIVHEMQPYRIRDSFLFRGN